jgi:hypothetical protein
MRQLASLGDRRADDLAFDLVVMHWIILYLLACLFTVSGAVTSAAEKNPFELPAWTMESERLQNG